MRSAAACGREGFAFARTSFLQNRAAPGTVLRTLGVVAMAEGAMAGMVMVPV